MLRRRFLGLPFPVFIAVAILLLALPLLGLMAGPLGKNALGLPDWLIVHAPEPELPVEEVFHLFGLPITNSIVAAWFTIIILVALSGIVTRRMKLVPGRLQTAFEFVLGSLYGFCQSVAGDRNGRRFFPIVTTIFLFVAFNAWLSLLPGFGSITIINTEGHQVHLLRGANTDFNLPLALALISFIFTLYFGLKAHRIHYVGQFINVGPFFNSLGLIVRGKIRDGLGGLLNGLIYIFVGLLELLSLFVRIVSFTFRLFGNMTAGEILILVIVFLIPWLGISLVLFYGLELLVGFVQALIFGGLTLVFLTVAVSAHGEETD